jgi:hypothetical protein
MAVDGIAVTNQSAAKVKSTVCYIACVAPHGCGNEISNKCRWLN